MLLLICDFLINFGCTIHLDDIIWILLLTLWFTGFSTPNTKYHRQVDKLRSLCIGIREVFNDIYQFDCNTESWTNIVIGGTFFPPGRRGHSSVYVGNIHPADSVDTLIKNRSLIIFGGAGFEIGKYSELLYNDTWLYSINLNKWDRVFPRGEIPRASYDHRAELVGEHMVIVGGILGTSRNLIMGTNDNSSVSKVLLLNIMTLTWTYINITSLSGAPVHLNMHGHALMRSSRSNPSKLIIFGGKESTDFKRAEELKQYGQQNKSNHLVELDISIATLTKVNVVNPAEEIPENRCGHVGISAISAEEMLSAHESYFGNCEVSYNIEEDLAKKPATSSSASSSSNDDATTHSEPVANGTPLCYIFGGSRINSKLGGFCDPILYHLKSVSKENPFNFGKRKYRNPFAKQTKGKFGMKYDNTNGNLTLPAKLPHLSSSSRNVKIFSPSQSHSSSSNTRGMKKESSRVKTSHAFDGDSDSLSDVDNVDDDVLSPNADRSVLSSHSSLWESRLAQQKKEFRPPSDWSELRLALMQPLTKKTLISSKQTTYLNDPYSMSISSKSTSKLGKSSLDSRHQIYNSSLMQEIAHEFHRTGALLEHSVELAMIPSDYNPRDYMKLSDQNKSHLIAKNLAETLGPKIKGMSTAEAKKVYYRHFPAPSTARHSVFNSTGSQIISDSRLI